MGRFRRDGQVSRRPFLPYKGLVGRLNLEGASYDIPGDCDLISALSRIDVEVPGLGGEERSSMAAFRL